MIEGGPGIGTTNIPAFSAEGKKSISKQLNGAIRYSMTIRGSSKKSDIVFRNRLRGFFFMKDVEPVHHRHGIFGFFHPDLTDFNLDPSETEGYTIVMPPDAFVVDSPGNDVNWSLTLEWGGVNRT